MIVVVVSTTALIFKKNTKRNRIYREDEESGKLKIHFNIILINLFCLFLFLFLSLWGSMYIF